MNGTKTDLELLEAFAGRRDQDAFAQIVARYGDLVYSAARRQVGATAADDVSQAVFLILAQKAQRIDGRLLAGWLVKAARLAGMAAGRMEQRRKQREEKAAVVNQQIASEPHDHWNDISPLLDEALARLGEADRCALTMRFLQGKSVREVAAAMNVSEEAAGKRALRAVGKLRDYFARRGVVNLTSESLGSALAANGIVAAPLGLAAKMAATGGAGTGSLATGTTSIAKGAVTLMTTAKVKLAAVVVAAVCVAGGSSVLIVKQMNAGRAAVQTSIAAPASLPTVLHAVAGETPLAPEPSTQPVAIADTLTRFATPAGEKDTFSGRAVDVVDEASAQAAVVYLRGAHWLNNANYQWQKLGPGGTFNLTADKFPDAQKALAIRAKGQSVTYLRAEFARGESAKDVVVHMLPTKMVTLAFKEPSGLEATGCKVEIFTGDRTDDQGRALNMQRLDATTAAGGTIAVRVPLEQVALFITGDRIAPYFQTIDPRASDRYELNLLAPAHISGRVTDRGKPVVGQRVVVSNDAVDLSTVNCKTDGQGRFRLIHGAPGMNSISVKGKHVNVKMVEGDNKAIDIELADPDTSTDPAAAGAATQPAPPAPPAP
jgi:RNA polymerase sigma factor (sigma-70 family)